MFLFWPTKLFGGMEDENMELTCKPKKSDV